MSKWVSRATAFLLAGIVTVTAARAENDTFVVIVHPDNPLTRIERGDLERIYRRFTDFWPDGTRILPINLPYGSPLRDRFTREVLRSDRDALATFWNRRYFDGVLPPAVLHSIEATRAFVAKRPNAIAYLPRGALNETVKRVSIAEGH